MTEEIVDVLPEAGQDVVFSRVSDGAVLLSTGAEVYYGLNETGARIWEHLEGCDTLEELCRALQEDYPDADPEVLRSDVEEILADLDDRGLLRPAGGEAALDATGGG